MTRGFVSALRGEANVFTIEVFDRPSSISSCNFSNCGRRLFFASPQMLHEMFSSAEAAPLFYGMSVRGAPVISCNCAPFASAPPRLARPKSSRAMSRNNGPVS